MTSLANGNSSGDAVNVGQLITLMQGLGHKRMHTAYVYVGDLLSAADSFGGYITAVSNASGTGFNYFSLTHPAITFNYVINARMYATRVATSDNDPAGHLMWIYPVSTTET